MNSPTTCRDGLLPSYSFIEPRYFVSRFRDKVPNDQHPPTNLIHGEKLIADVYNALRAGPNWTKTLLIITYDEHGGTFDHASPPSATPPGPPYGDGFTFNRFGARVPAVLISPLIPPGSVIRPPSPDDEADVEGEETSPKARPSITLPSSRRFRNCSTWARR